MSQDIAQQQYDALPRPAAALRLPALDVPELIGSAFLVGLLLCVCIAAVIMMPAYRLWSLVCGHRNAG
jgi:hypothetical protein